MNEATDMSTLRRVEELVGDKKWVWLLEYLLACVDKSGAPGYPVESVDDCSSESFSLTWSEAFHLVYSSDFLLIPLETDRYYRFSEFVVNVWRHLETLSPETLSVDENSCREEAMRQYKHYKRACALRRAPPEGRLTMNRLLCDQKRLQQVLDCIEKSGAPDERSAEPMGLWAQAFDLVYNGPAQNFTRPTGHKRSYAFQQKVVRLWTALQSETHTDNPCRKMAMNQIDRFNRARILRASNDNPFLASKHTVQSKNCPSTNEEASCVSIPRSEKSLKDCVSAKVVSSVPLEFFPDRNDAFEFDGYPSDFSDGTLVF